MKQRRLEPKKESKVNYILQPRMFGFLVMGWVFFWILVFIVGIILNMDARIGGF